MLLTSYPVNQEVCGGGKGIKFCSSARLNVEQFVSNGFTALSASVMSWKQHFAFLSPLFSVLTTSYCSYCCSAGYTWMSCQWPASHFEKVQYIMTVEISFLLLVELSCSCKGPWYLEFMVLTSSGEPWSRGNYTVQPMQWIKPLRLSRCICLHCDPFSKSSVLIGQTLFYILSQSVMPELPSWPLKASSK